MTGTEREQLQSEFQATATQPKRVAVTLEMPADVVEWLEARPLGLQGELNDLARFFMDTSTAPVEAYEDSARWEIAGPEPDHNADKSTTNSPRPDIPCPRGEPHEHEQE